MLRTGDRRVVLLLGTHVSVRKVDRRVLATDIVAELVLRQLWPQPCGTCGGNRRDACVRRKL